MDELPGDVCQLGFKPSTHTHQLATQQTRPPASASLPLNYPRDTRLAEPALVSSMAAFIAHVTSCGLKNGGSGADQRCNLN